MNIRKTTYRNKKTGQIVTLPNIGMCSLTYELLKVEDVIEFNDTERLEWIIENNARLVQKPNGLWVCEIIRLNGYRSIGDFATAREAIDAGIEEK